MAGLGSGLWYRFDSKSTVEEYRQLPIHHFAPALRQVATGEREAHSCADYVVSARSGGGINPRIMLNVPGWW
jgi:hypothetical protein